MRVLLLTNEFPPHVYGGAGVHVEYLSRELARLVPVEVRHFHPEHRVDGGLTVNGTAVDPALLAGAPPKLAASLRALAHCVAFNGRGIDADLVHCHTWYTHFGGIVAKLIYGVPLVVTVHSLEPLRPWKREQMGRGYELSSFVERTALEMADAVIAVSKPTADDVVREFDVDPQRITVIENGLDVDEYRPVERPEVLARLGVDPARPFVLFVGRTTRQKGVVHLLDAAEHLDPALQVVFCAGEADTPELGAELRQKAEALQQRRGGIVWIPRMLDRADVIALYGHAAVFCCPSIYEPFGIINLEAMACGTPVVASAVGGIPDVVVDGQTGVLVDPKLSARPPHEPTDPAGFAQALACAIDGLVRDPERSAGMAAAGRRRVVDQFSWGGVASRTLRLYEVLCAGERPRVEGGVGSGGA